MIFCILLIAAVISLAPLEREESGIYFGAWYNRIRGDTPVQITNRVDFKHFSVWQMDINLSETNDLEAILQSHKHILETGTDAVLYVTVYPILGFLHVNDEALKDFANVIAEITRTGRKVFIRYASEMNGSWFPYGQQPTLFKESWKKFVDAVRSQSARDNVAFIWAPNSGNGYPFPNSFYSAYANDTTFDKALDTNNDGKYDADDDPYTPFYPGDEYVDWVGMSIYHYGDVYPWEVNTIPIPGQIEAIITGKPGWGNFSIYDMYCAPKSEKSANGTEGGKPFFITETGATTHLSVIKDSPEYRFPQIVDEDERRRVREGVRPIIPEKHLPEGGRWIKPENTSAEARVLQKQTWWRQYLNSTFLELFPKVKGACTFEFFKFEESSFRDFTNFGVGPNEKGPEGYTPEGGELVLKAFQDDLKAGLDKDIIWAKKTGISTVSLVFIIISIFVFVALVVIGIVYYFHRKFKTQETRNRTIVLLKESNSSDSMEDSITNKSESNGESENSFAPIIVAS